MAPGAAIKTVPLEAFAFAFASWALVALSRSFAHPSEELVIEGFLAPRLKAFVLEPVLLFLFFTLFFCLLFFYQGVERGSFGPHS